MDKRSITLFVHKHSILLSVGSFLFIQLPQYVEALWSLIEHISGTTKPVEGGGSVSVSWMYWITVPFGLIMLGFVFWLVRKPVLSKAEKSKVAELMASMNALDDRINRFFNEALAGEKDRVPKYKDMLDRSDFKDLWDKCSAQRAAVSIISPELSERVRLLLSITQVSYAHLLRDWHTDEVFKLRADIEEHVKIVELVRRRIKESVDRLIG